MISFVSREPRMPSPIRPLDLKARLSADPLRVYLLDVRQPQEHEFAAIPGDKLIPLDELPGRAREIDLAPGQTLVVYCHHGVRSWHAACFLEAQGFEGVMSLSGGIEAYSVEVDPAIPRY